MRAISDTVSGRGRMGIDSGRRVEFVFSVTGHRPNRLGGYNKQTYEKLDKFAMSVLSETKPHSLVVGCALGTDLAFAKAARSLGIAFVAAIPFKGWNSNWPDSSKKFVASLLESASKIVYVSQPPYSASKLFRRNEWMIDNSDAVFCLWDGQASGGTYAAKNYAESKNKTVIDLWYQWEDFDVS